MKNIECLKKFFEAESGKKIQLAELKALTQVEREELAALAAKEMGVVLEK